MASCSWFLPRTFNGSHPVLGSRHERSTARILFLVPATNDQRMASRHCRKYRQTPMRTPNWNGSWQKLRTGCDLLMVRGGSEQQDAMGFSKKIGRATFVAASRLNLLCSVPGRFLGSRRGLLLRTWSDPLPAGVPSTVREHGRSGQLNPPNRPAIVELAL